MFFGYITPPCNQLDHFIKVNVSLTISGSLTAISQEFPANHFIMITLSPYSVISLKTSFLRKSCLCFRSTIAVPSIESPPDFQKGARTNHFITPRRDKFEDAFSSKNAFSLTFQYRIYQIYFPTSHPYVSLLLSHQDV